MSEFQKLAQKTVAKKPAQKTVAKKLVCVIQWPPAGKKTPTPYFIELCPDHELNEVCQHLLFKTYLDPDAQEKTGAMKPSKKGVAKKPAKETVAKKPSKKRVATKPAKETVAKKPARKEDSC